MFVLVTGPPASGKTSLAVPLARDLGLPALAKDTIKEVMHDGLPPSGSRAAWSRHLSDTSYALVLALVESVPAAVLDLNLPLEWASRFDELDRPLAQVFCRCPQEVLERRLLERATTRHPAHQDDVILDDVRSQGVRGTEPAPLNAPLLEVDTSAPVDIAMVAGRLRDVLLKA
jgi:predicted kinase